MQVTVSPEYPLLHFSRANVTGFHFYDDFVYFLHHMPSGGL